MHPLFNDRADMKAAAPFRLKKRPGRPPGRFASMVSSARGSATAGPNAKSSARLFLDARTDAGKIGQLDAIKFGPDVLQPVTNIAAQDKRIVDGFVLRTPVGHELV